MEFVLGSSLFSSAFMGLTASLVGFLLLIFWGFMFIIGVKVERPLYKLAGIVLASLSLSMLIGIYDDLEKTQDYAGGVLGRQLAERCSQMGVETLMCVILWLVVPLSILLATDWLFLGPLFRGPRRRRASPPARPEVAPAVDEPQERVYQGDGILSAPRPVSQRPGVDRPAAGAVAPGTWDAAAAPEAASPSPASVAPAPASIGLDSFSKDAAEDEQSVPAPDAEALTEPDASNPAEPASPEEDLRAGDEPGLATGGDDEALVPEPEGAIGGVTEEDSPEDLLSGSRISPVPIPEDLSEDREEPRREQPGVETTSGGGQAWWSSGSMDDESGGEGGATETTIPFGGSASSSTPWWAAGSDDAVMSDEAVGEDEQPDEEMLEADTGSTGGGGLDTDAKTTAAAESEVLEAGESVPAVEDAPGEPVPEEENTEDTEDSEDAAGGAPSTAEVVEEEREIRAPSPYKDVLETFNRITSAGAEEETGDDESARDASAGAGLDDGEEPPVDEALGDLDVGEPEMEDLDKDLDLPVEDDNDEPFVVEMIEVDTQDVEGETGKDGDASAPAQADQPDKARGESDGDERSEGDVLKEAVALLVQEGQGSIAMLQRKLGIGYFQAAQLLNRLESQGVMGPPDGNIRKTLIGEEDVARFIADETS